MLSKIYKYVVPLEEDAQIKMPKNAKILHVGEQSGEVTIWAEVSSDAKEVTRRLAVRGTGQPFRKEPDEIFLGTVMVGIYVWHVYDRGDWS